jgi:alpha-1,2-mannosyltransferase
VTERRLALVVLLVAGSVAVNLLLWRLGATTTLRYTRMLVNTQASADSWRPMARALAAWDRGEPIYRTVFFRGREKFQYPPSSLLLPLAVRQNPAADLPLFRALNRIGLWLTVLTACSVALLAAMTWRNDPTVAGLARLAAATLLVWLSTFLFFPVVISYVLGQIQTVITAAVAVALVAWLRRRDDLAGVAVGIAALVKPHFALLVLWGATRGRWRFVAASGMTVAAGTILAMAVFGPAEYVDYVRALGYMGARGEALYANQTVNGLVNRLVQPPDHRGWDFHSYPPPHPLVLAATATSSLLLLAGALWAPRRLGFAGTPLDLAIMWLTVIMASPIAWDHHYGGLLPILVAGVGIAWRTSAGWAAPALAACALLTGNLWEPLIDVDAPPWNIVQSYVLAGSILTLGTLYRVGARAGSGPAAYLRETV